MAGTSLAEFFGQVVRRNRLAQGLTQEELADRAKLHPTYIGLIERGAKNPSIDVCFQISEGLGHSLVNLLSEAQELLQRQEATK